MRKLILGLLVGLGLASTASASIVIQFEDLNVQYVRTGVFTADITDAGGAAGDPVIDVNFFYLDDDTNVMTFLGELPDSHIDFHFDTAAITNPGVIAGVSQFFNLSSNGFFLNLGTAGVAGLVANNSLVALSVTNAQVLGFNLPFNVQIEDPARFTLSGQLLSSTTQGFFIPVFGTFAAVGPGSIITAGQVPEPAILSLLGIGLLGLGFAKRSAGKKLA